MRYERDYYGAREGNRGWNRGEQPRGYGDWGGFDRSPHRDRGFGYRNMDSYESDYRFTPRGRFASGYDRGFREDTTRVFRPSHGGYDRGYSGGYDRGYRSSPGADWTAPRPSFYGQGEINRWSSPGGNPFPGTRTGFATGFGMGHGRFL